MCVCVHDSSRVIERMKKRAGRCKIDSNQLDAQFAGDTMCKPFTMVMAQTSATGNANFEGHLVEELCARYVGPKAENSYIIPEEVRSARGSPYDLLLPQF